MSKIVNNSLLDNKSKIDQQAVYRIAIKAILRFRAKAELFLSIWETYDYTNLGTSLNKLHLINIMKRSLLFTVAFGITALLGTTSCTSKDTTQAEVQTQQEIKLGGSSSTHTAIKIIGDTYAVQNQNVKL
ncbi:MAG: hypothetical protein SWZ49_25990, partial [Cyanobacteriota bacterium]|nr:hypothetical protein [Cyanobacteriota bacterium]